MNKIFALFPLNKSATKTVKLGLLKAIGLNILAMLVVYIVSVITKGIPLIRNLTGNFERIFEIYGLIGMIMAAIQRLTDADVSQIDYINIEKIKQLFLGDKKKISLIATGVVAVILCLVPAYHTPKAVTEVSNSSSTTETADSTQTQDAKEETIEAEESTMDVSETEVETAEAEAEPEDDFVLTQEMKEDLGYTDENGEIVYNFMYGTEAEWAMMTFNDPDHKVEQHYATKDKWDKITSTTDKTWDYDRDCWKIVYWSKPKTITTYMSADMMTLIDTIEEDNIKRPGFVPLPVVTVRGHDIEYGKTTLTEINAMAEEFGLHPTFMERLEVNNDGVYSFRVQYGSTTNLDENNHFSALFYYKDFSGFEGDRTVFDTKDEFNELLEALNYDDYVMVSFDSYNTLREGDASFSFGNTYKDFNDYFYADIERNEHLQKNYVLEFSDRKESGATCVFHALQTCYGGGSSDWYSYVSDKSTDELSLWNFSFDTNSNTIKSRDDLDFSHE